MVRSKMGAAQSASVSKSPALDDRLCFSHPASHGAAVERSRGSDWLAEQIGAQAEHVADRAAIGERLVSEAREGDRIVIMGARDDSLSEFAAELVARLGERN